ncbi:anti-sigma factor [Candidatus Woesearchaeota archaeon]|nr:anti-sigma factor [Candidatus Woesearchaeota archaeon]
MKRIAVAILALMLAGAVTGLHGFVKDPAYEGLDMNRKGIERVTNFDARIQTHGYTWQAVAHLEPLVTPLLARGFPDIFPRGTANVYSARYNQDISSGVKIRVGELIPSYSREYVYEAWLVDRDTDYWLSLGLFDTIGRGTGELELQKLNRYLDYYDSVVVTREPFPDSNPAPSKEIMLRGDIFRNSPAPYLPPATTQQKLWGVSTFYRSN